MTGKPKLDASSMRLPQNKMIELDSVAMQWDNHVALQNVCLSIDEGDFVAITGTSGVGKSTLIRLLLALLRPREGSISLYSEGGFVQAPVAASTRCNLVYVPQGNSLFSGTIRENLLIGNPDATEEQMLEALRTAAAEFVMEMPAGLDSQCFEKGAGLSEGQAQRIAIARALLRPGRVLLLDEFSSALDAKALMSPTTCTGETNGKLPSTSTADKSIV